MNKESAQPAAQPDLVPRRRYDRERIARAEAERLLETRSRELYELNQQLTKEAVKLRFERRRSERSERAKTKFLATISHELRTPMNGILGMAAILDSTTLDEPQRAMLETIKKSARNLLVIIEDMLDFATLESGATYVESNIIHPVEIVEACIRDHLPDAEDKGIYLRLDADESVRRPVVGDGVRIRQIFEHLVSNAVRFTEAGGVSVRMRCARDSDQRIRLEADVADTGVGMNADALDRLFLPFGLADSSSTRPFGGVGIGLAIARRLCRLMGGNVSAESTVGRGSTFRFFVIVDHAPRDAAATGPRG